MILIDENYDIEDVADRLWERRGIVAVGDSMEDASGVPWLLAGFWRTTETTRYMLVAGAVRNPETRLEMNASDSCLHVNFHDRAVIMIETFRLSDGREHRRTMLRLPGKGDPVLYG